MPRHPTFKQGGEGVFSSRLLGMLRSIDGWRLCAFAVSALVVTALAVIFVSWRHETGDIWRHLVDTLLPDLLRNTAKLVAGVLFGTLLLGVSLAWLTAACDFPGRRLLRWALLLPMAMPAYVLAFVFLGVFDFSGPIATWGRELFGNTFRLPDIRSAAGVSLVMSLVLYPYVYLLARNAFATQGIRMVEAAQSLGSSPLRAFWQVVLPMARPWIVAGLMLVLMETLADFGAVSIFNYDTFTTAIYKAWFGFFSLHAAAQLASILVVLVLVVLVIEQRMRSRMRFVPSRGDRPQELIRLRGWRRWGAVAYCWCVLTFAFLLPLVQLVGWTLSVFAEEYSSRYWDFLFHSLTLGALSALTISLLALLLSYAVRRHPDLATRAMVRLSVTGYALPGTVLAVGIYIPVAATDNFLADNLRAWFGWDVGLLIQGTIAIMLLAYTVRFMAAGFGAIDSAMHRITPSIDDAARQMGLRGAELLFKVYLPILRGGICTAAAMVFIDVMKEMPITLMTRPFGWDTLSVKIFELTSEGEWERAALPAVSLVIAGLIPIVMLMKKEDR